MKMKICEKCAVNPAANHIGICGDCLRALGDDLDVRKVHIPVRKSYNLPINPPKNTEGKRCTFCSNMCQILDGESGFCGVRVNENGHLQNKAPKGTALAYMYYDPLPSNCCAAWFCEGSKKAGQNLAVFFYGCNFDCLFCQNSSHKLISKASVITEDDMVSAALNPTVRCICFFGGSPEPQLPFSLRVAERVLKESPDNKHICWECNGCGNSKLVATAAALAAESKGTIKFDLKAFSSPIVRTLCGVDNRQSFDNFTTIAKRFMGKKILTATTLLVPYYVNEYEVEKIAHFIADINPSIPYSILIFHPDFYMRDLPITPKKQVYGCYEAAKKYLDNVNIGNRHLLGYAM